MDADVNDDVDTTAGEEITDTAEGWKPDPNWDAAAEVTEPVKNTLDLHAAAAADAAMKLNDVLETMGEASPLMVAPKPLAFDIQSEGDDGPTEAEIAAAHALLARAGKGSPTTRDPDAPVSDKPIPINLRDDSPPAREQQTRLMIGEMEVIGSPERIEYVRKAYGLTEVEVAAQRAIPAERVPQPMAPMVAEKISAEQEAGRRALAQQQARMVSHPRPAKTPEELELEKPPVTIFRGAGNDAKQNLLRRPAQAGKGGGY